MPGPRWLLCGGWEFDIYESACAAALARLGVDVVPFSWSPFFRGLTGWAELKWGVSGPATRAMNQALLAEARRTKADVVFVWRGTRVLPSTLDRLRRETSATLVSYNNDDPFSPVYAAGGVHMRRLWRLFHRAIPHYDVHFVYRPVNIAEMNRAGSRETHLLMPYFIPELDRPADLSPEDRARYATDVVFIGHYEDDGRADCIRALIDGGVDVRLFGNGWTPAALGPLAGRIPAPVLLRGAEYRKALSAARMALCFLSRLNRDVYTRRSFEIPACGAALVSERTPELQALFEENREAVYFSSPSELVANVRALVADPDRITAIAAAGRRRVHEDGHSVDDRMRHVLDLLGAHIGAPRPIAGPV